MIPNNKHSAKSSVVDSVLENLLFWKLHEKTNFPHSKMAQDRQQTVQKQQKEIYSAYIITT